MGGKWILRNGLGHNGLLNYPSLFGKSSGRLEGAKLYFIKQGSLSFQIFLCKHTCNACTLVSESNYLGWGKSGNMNPR